MGTTLRVGFAMGGGNSLGTFNGAALSQALKLLLLRGLDRSGKPYDRVEVDVFSGASAGSLSLALMLRCLAHPDPDRMMAAKVKLIAEFGAEFTKLSRDAKQGMIAAQVLQDVQEEVWVREINLERLLGLTSPEAQRRIRFTAGLLDRGAVEELARRYLAFPSPGDGGGETKIDLSKRQVLADRVLFASSIANLTPIIADATGEFPTDEVGLLGLSDGMTSSIHSELRIFDLHFTQVDADSLTDADSFPRRWCRYHAGSKVRDTHGTGRGIGSLFEGRGWWKIAATSIASGAIPFAFEPVPLERRDYEFGETEGRSLSEWPRALKGKDRHVFTYVDGGTFNNEPIREAFRLASFVDAQNPEADFERLILFVDPHVVVPEVRLDLPHHGRWLLEKPNRLLSPIGGADLKRKTSLDRLVPFTGSILTAVTNESRVVEADKVFRTRKNFQIRNLLRKELEGTLAPDPDPSALESLAAMLADLLEAERTGVMIPAGALTLEGELRRVIAEEGGKGGTLGSLREKTAEDIGAFAAGPGTAQEDERGAWLKALTFAAMDRVMDLEGKMERSQLVAISPAIDPADPTRMEELPGRAVHGFGGFMSELAGEHEVDVARYCTQLFLEAAGRIRTGPLPEKPDFSGQRAAFLKDVEAGLELAEARLVGVLADSHLDVLGALPAGVLRHFIRGKLVRLAREKAPAITWELRIQVPNMSYEFDGKGLADRDLKPEKIGGKFYLVTFATYEDGAPKPWTGSHVLVKKQALKVDRDRKGVLPDKEFCRVALPTKAMLVEGKSLAHPIWVARIKASDQGKRVGSDRWRLMDEVQGLEGTIQG